MVDVLYLKNGSIIRGTITEMVPNKTIKIKMADGSLFVYKMEEVEKFVKEENATVKPVFTKQKPEPTKEIKDSTLYITKREGLYFDFKSGCGYMINPSQFTVAITPIIGYKFSPYFGLGIGVGYITIKYSAMYYMSPGAYNYSKNLNIVPIFLQAKFLIIEKKVSPTLTGDLGLVITASRSSQPYLNGYYGAYGDFGAGLLIYIQKSLNINLSVDIAYIGNKMTDPDSNREFSLGPIYLLKIGMGF
jgi:hypothetical protein